jgi:hypothetical protein
VTNRLLPSRVAAGERPRAGTADPQVVLLAQNEAETSTAELREMASENRIGTGRARP